MIEHLRKQGQKRRRFEVSKPTSYETLLNFLKSSDNQDENSKENINKKTLTECVRDILMPVANSSERTWLHEACEWIQYFSCKGRRKQPENSPLLWKMYDEDKNKYNFQFPKLNWIIRPSFEDFAEIQSSNRIPVAYVWARFEVLLHLGDWRVENLVRCGAREAEEECSLPLRRFLTQYWSQTPNADSATATKPNLDGAHKIGACLAQTKCELERKTFWDYFWNGVYSGLKSTRPVGPEDAAMLTSEILQNFFPTLRLSSVQGLPFPAIPSVVERSVGGGVGLGDRLGNPTRHHRSSSMEADSSVDILSPQGQSPANFLFNANASNLAEQLLHATAGILFSLNILVSVQTKFTKVFALIKTLDQLCHDCRCRHNIQCSRRWKTFMHTS